MGYTIDVPPGDPSVITSAADTLQRIAQDLDEHAGIISGEQAGIDQAWKDANGKSAATQAGNLSGKAREFGRHAGVASTALRTFASALETAQSEIRGLQGQLDQARQAAATEASRDPRLNEPNLSRDTKGEIRESIDHEHMQPIVDAANGKLTILNQAAAACRKTLEGATPVKDKNPQHIAAEMLDYLAPTIPAAAAEEGRELADQLNPLIDNGKPIPPDVVKRLEQYQNNPYFAQTFLPGVGADRIYKMTFLMKARQPGYQDTVSNTQLLSTFGHMIAAGTADNAPAPLPKRFIDSLLSPLDDHNQDGIDHAWGLSEIMTAAGNPQAGRAFLDKVGYKLYGLESGIDPNNIADYFGGPNSSVITDDNPNGIDPTGWYFSQLGHDPLASQDFFLNPAHTEFYLTGRGRTAGGEFLDNGDALAGALRSATTAVRAGPDADRSAQAAMVIVNALGNNPDANFLEAPSRSGIAKASGDILVAYAPDIVDSFAADHATRGFGHALFDRTEIMNAMRQSFNVPDNYNRVLGAVAGAGYDEINHSVDGARSFNEGHFKYNDALGTFGRSLGAVYASGKGALAVDAADVDDTNNFVNKGMGLIVSHTVGAIPYAGTVISDAFGLVGDIPFPGDHERDTIVAGIEGRDGFSQQFDGNLAPDHARQQLQHLLDQQHDEYAPPLQTTLNQDQNNWHANTHAWAATTWSDDGKTINPPDIYPEHGSHRGAS